MTRLPATLFLCGLIAAIPLRSLAQSGLLDRLDESLSWQSKNGFVRTDLAGLVDLEGYYIDQTPPGLIFTDDDFFFNPRLSLFLDAHFGEHFYAFAQARFDRGFDPGSKPDGDARLDEYFARYTPFEQGWLNLQAGKFATVFGQWVQRHDSWNNPFINAPLAYEGMLGITDQAAPPTPGAFLARRNRPDQKTIWLPTIWGPAYTSGASVFGTVERFDYAFELKNASISSRPSVWDATDLSWEYPTTSGRIGYRPGPAWNLGASFSHGAYMLPASEPTLPTGTSLGDFRQTTVGTDVSFSWRRLQIWSEVIATRFEVPNVGDAELLSYFIEARQKLTPRIFAAVRWNQQFTGQVADGLGGEQDWDHDAWRADGAIGIRFTRHLQAKLQYGYNHQQGPIQQGEQFAALQLTVKF